MVIKSGQPWPKIGASSPLSLFYKFKTSLCFSVVCCSVISELSHFKVKFISLNCIPSDWILSSSKSPARFVVYDSGASIFPSCSDARMSPFFEKNLQLAVCPILVTRGWVRVLSLHFLSFKLHFSDPDDVWDDFWMTHAYLFIGYMKVRTHLRNREICQMDFSGSDLRLNHGCATFKCFSDERHRPFQSDRKAGCTPGCRVERYAHNFPGPFYLKQFHQ